MATVSNRGGHPCSVTGTHPRPTGPRACSEGPRPVITAEPIEVPTRCSGFIRCSTARRMVARRQRDIQTIEDLAGHRVIALLRRAPPRAVAVRGAVRGRRHSRRDRLDLAASLGARPMTRCAVVRLDCILLTAHGTVAPPRFMTELYGDAAGTDPGRSANELMAAAGEINGGARPGIVPASAVPEGAESDMTACLVSPACWRLRRKSRRKWAYTVMSSVFENLEEVRLHWVWQFQDIEPEFRCCESRWAAIRSQGCGAVLQGARPVDR